MLYLWLKALHIIAVIAWMAGMLYLPRLFVYHADAPVRSDKSETFKVMEYRLLRYITTPAMLAALIFGAALIYEGGLLKAGWLLGCHGAGVPRGPQHAPGALLSPHQRGADPADDRHRHPGSGEAVLTGRSCQFLASSSATLAGTASFTIRAQISVFGHAAEAVGVGEARCMGRRVENNARTHGFVDQNGDLLLEGHLLFGRGAGHGVHGVKQVARAGRYRKKK